MANDYSEDDIKRRAQEILNWGNPQGNLHPLNRAGVPHNWDSPDWEPPAFPPKSEMPAPTPEAMKEYLELTQALAPHAYRLWPDMASFLKELYDRHVAGTPWQRLLEPRRIVPPGGYPSPKYVAGALYAMFTEIADKHKAGFPIPPMEITAELISYQVVKSRVPIYYVAEDFIRAIEATKFPTDLTLYDLKWPQPAMVVCFPPNFMRKYTGRSISYVFAADLPANAYVPPEWLSILTDTPHPAIECPDKVSFQFHAYNEGRVENFVTSWLKKHKLVESIGRYGYVDYTNANEAKVADDDRVLQLVGKLFLKLLLVMNIRDSVLEPGVCQRKAGVAGTKHGQKTELWSPHMIGFKYKPTRKAGPLGTHASPSWHPRDGHFTHQRQGSWKDPNFVSISTLPRLMEGPDKGQVDWDKVSSDVRVKFWGCHERIWIEPTWVNLDALENAPAGSAGSAPAKAVP